MSMAATETPAGADPNDLEARLVYAVDSGEKLINQTMEPGNLDRKVTGTYQDHPMTVRNGRPLRDAFDLDLHGFVFVDHPTQVPDFYVPENVENIYYPEAEKLLLQTTGAARVHIFDHTLRHGDEADRKARLVREPVRAVHNDYTEWSGPQRVRDLLPDEAEELLKKRHGIVQIWRATNTPIEADPLCIGDARSLDFADMIVAERRYPDRIGQTYRIQHNPKHEFYWFPKMTRDEAIVFKVFDSATDGRARWTAHTSFVNPLSRAGAPPRESIELRALVFWDD
ncbi:MAG: CmcJ/NvfI family oxidoreductase [Alphaproteobacteria bacterium]